jgi:hypothetical protein
MYEKPVGVPIEYLIKQRRQKVVFTCGCCSREVTKTPQQLLDLASPDTGLKELSRRLKCSQCGATQFSFAVSYP